MMEIRTAASASGARRSTICVANRVQRSLATGNESPVKPSSSEDFPLDWSRRRLAERIVTIFSLNRIDALTYLRQRDILIDTKLAKLINDAEDPDAIIVVQFVNA